MSKSDYDNLTPCTIQRTVPGGYLIETRSRVMIVNPQRLVQTHYGWAVKTKPKAEICDIIDR